MTDQTGPAYGHSADDQTTTFDQHLGFPPPPPPGYGVAPYAPPPPPAYQQVLPKSPAVAVVLSLLIPGLGSMVAGNGAIGSLILVLYIVSAIASAFLIGIPFAIGIWIWGMINAHGSAVAWNRKHGILS